MVINFDFRHGAKKSGHLDHPLQSYGQIYFNIFLYISAKLGWLWMTTRYIKNNNCFVNDMLGLLVAFRSAWFSTPEPPEKRFLQKTWFFGDLDFPSVSLVRKSLKALCLSFKMVYQHLFYLLSLWTYRHFKITEGPTVFSMANLASGLQWAETAVPESWIFHFNFWLKQ